MSAQLTSSVADVIPELLHGGVVAIPTETVYGLAADAFNAQAVAKIFAVKERPAFDPLIVHVVNRDMLARIVTEIPTIAETLIAQFWPGPLTLILPKREEVPDLVTSGLPHVAVRMPRHPLTLQLLREADCPLAAPSANLFGRVSPTTATHVAEQLGDRINWILDGGPCAIGVESTVLDLTGSRPRILRPGGITHEALAEFLDNLEELPHSSTEQVSASPGQLPSHYAPRVPLYLTTEKSAWPHSERCGYLAFSSPPSGNWQAVEVLSPRGDLNEAAAALFAALRRLEAANITWIAAELAPPHGLGRAINDRLTRAAFRP